MHDRVIYRIPCSLGFDMLCCLTRAEGHVDLQKIDPILFDFMRTLYWSLGEVAGKPWSAGKVLKGKA